MLPQVADIVEQSSRVANAGFVELVGILELEKTQLRSKGVPEAGEVLVAEAILSVHFGVFLCATHREKKGQKGTRDSWSSGALAKGTNGGRGRLGHATMNMRPKRFDECNRGGSMVKVERGGNEQVIERRSENFPSITWGVEKPLCRGGGSRNEGGRG